MLFKKRVLLRFLKVMENHLGTHFLNGDFRNPSKLLFGFGRISQERLDFSRAEVSWVYADNDIPNIDRRRFFVIDCRER